MFGETGHACGPRQSRGEPSAAAQPLITSFLEAKGRGGSAEEKLRALTALRVEVRLRTAS